MSEDQHSHRIEWKQTGNHITPFSDPTAKAISQERLPYELRIQPVPPRLSTINSFVGFKNSSFWAPLFFCKLPHHSFTPTHSLNSSITFSKKNKKLRCHSIYAIFGFIFKLIEFILKKSFTLKFLLLLIFLN